ncbi:hypothetical protein Dda_8516 [Drechslerella dactyloides]|uniref:MTHFR SAM-binding regulatory domain-containing protein n=1 Tax=Drechslerella dactyloides TaxID=74499 RepID=A0AAD6ITE9_DREDA|nr:hypothetical protein Dda_8516 [Drechslerella dactyloides]
MHIEVRGAGGSRCRKSNIPPRAPRRPHRRPVNCNCPRTMQEKITAKIKALPKDATYFSLEFFPPKTQAGLQNLHARLERMAKGLRPLFVSVTWGAGGSTATKSLELAHLCLTLGLTTVLHLTCTNMSRAVLDDALDNAKLIGVRNILALRGDEPRQHEYLDRSSAATPLPPPEFAHAVDLVKYIRKRHGDLFAVGVAAYPEGYAESAYPERQDPLQDLPYLREKTAAGADFIMTQFFYDVDAYLSFERRLRGDASGVFDTVPIIPGLMPVQSHQIFRRTTKLCSVKVPQGVSDRIEAAKADDEVVKEQGIQIVSEIIERIKASTETAGGGARGFHFYTLNLEKAVAFIAEKCNLIPEIPTPAIAIEDEVAIVDDDGSPGPLLAASSGAAGSSAALGPRRMSRRASSIVSDPYNRVIVDTVSSARSDHQAEAGEAGVPKILDPGSQEGQLAISEGEGALGREATWDDFPNGRWGDARSPAFGEIDGYGVSLHRTPTEALRLWGTPTSTSDISALFVRNVNGSLAAMPWSEEDSLNAESKLITAQLEALNSRGWWTVASQPAVNSARSDDPTFGWGPRGGFVFQKAFVEFFIPEAEWSVLRAKLEGSEDVSFYAGNKAGDFETSMPSDTATNAVTWGAFPGKEIVTPTIIEEVSFRAWRDEAFDIWSEWQRIYPPSSPTAKLLGELKDKLWLVTIIHHDFVDTDALWKGVLGL